jgi:hypothetical protein
MPFDIYEASGPVFVAMLRNMRAWLDKAEAEGEEASLIDARLAPDMFALPKQYQVACDTAKLAVARLSGVQAPVMEDTEASFAELRDRIDATLAYIQSVDRSAFDGAETREVVIRFPNGQGYRFEGLAYLTGFAIPNFYFHAMAAYAILRNAGIAIGKPDYLQHLGRPLDSVDA